MGPEMTLLEVLLGLNPLTHSAADKQRDSGNRQVPARGGVQPTGRCEPTGAFRPSGGSWAPGQSGTTGRALKPIDVFESGRHLRGSVGFKPAGHHLTTPASPPLQMPRVSTFASQHGSCGQFHFSSHFQTCMAHYRRNRHHGHGRLCRESDRREPALPPAWPIAQISSPCQISYFQCRTQVVLWVVVSRTRARATPHDSWGDPGPGSGSSGVRGLAARHHSFCSRACQDPRHMPHAICHIPHITCHISHGTWSMGRGDVHSSVLLIVPRGSRVASETTMP
jgi:hypothetical protein